MAQQWKLLGSTESYLVVWWYDQAVKDTTLRVSSLNTRVLLDSWSRRRGPVLRQIYEALEGNQSLQVAAMSARPDEARLKQVISDAVRSGRLVVLTIAKESIPSLLQQGTGSPTFGKPTPADALAAKFARPSQENHGTPDTDPADEKYLLFDIEIHEGISEHEFIVRGHMKAFGLKNKEEAEALLVQYPVKLRGFEGRPTPKEIRQGHMPLKLSASLYEKIILARFGSDADKVKEKIKARREELDACSPQGQAVFREKLAREFKNRTGRALSTPLSPEDQIALNILQGELLLVEDLSRLDLEAADALDTRPLGVVVWDDNPMLRLRSEPSTTSTVTASLAFNTHVQIMQRLPGDWLHVSTRDGREGYVAANYLWSAPQHPLLEPNVRVHRVEKYNRATGAGTAIAIAQKYYKVGKVQNLRFYVALLAAANRIPIPASVEGWKQVELAHRQLIWVPSQQFADAMRGKINSGSYTYELADSLGVADIVEAVENALDRLNQLLSDLGKAVWRSLRYLPGAIARHVTQSAIAALTSLLEMAVQAMLLLAVFTALGAAIGALFGGVGAAPGAAIGFEVGLAVLEWAGLYFLLEWIADAVSRIGSAFVAFLESIWNARGDSAKIDQAAQELAEALGVIYGLAIEALVMWAAFKGAEAALSTLKGSKLERAFGTGEFGSWLRERLEHKSTGGGAKEPAHSNQGKTPAEGNKANTAREVKEKENRAVLEKAFNDWVEGLPQKETPSNTPQDLFEITHTGPRNHQVSGGGEKVWTDGVRALDQSLLEAKYIEKPERSPFIEPSECPEFVRERILEKVRDEFRRYSEVIKDPANPSKRLEVIVNDARAVPLFEALLKEYGIPGRVVVR
jgi:hypothetical protein